MELCDAECAEALASCIENTDVTCSEAYTQATSIAAQQVVVAMKIFAADPLATPLPIPDTTSLAAQLAQQLGQQVVVTIENEAPVSVHHTPCCTTSIYLTYFAVFLFFGACFFTFHIIWSQ